MAINWKLRLTNKATLAALAAAVVTFVYQVLSVLGITPTVGSEQVTNLIGIVLTLLTTLGVITDPTTTGVSDSTRALAYDTPVASSGAAPEDEDAA